MKIKFYLLLFTFFSLTASAQTLETFQDFSGIKINGDTLDFSTFAGKKVLVVNTASYCGFTPQYADLEQLYLQYGGTDFTILGFPCNDFGGQEPGDDGQIDTFCTSTYNITFQMMAKISITAIDTAEVYKWLQLQSRNGVMNAPVLWNFQKFMIDEAGHWHDYKLSAVNPLDTSITNWITSPSVLSVNEKATDISNININPNPCKDNARININTKNKTKTSIKIFGNDGRFIQTVFNGDIENQNQISFATTDLQNGIYFLKIETEKSLKTIKLCVIR
ncbi:MAG: T9SS type A sorting domain-containing protein [Bacteroidia bacterium]